MRAFAALLALAACAVAEKLVFSDDFESLNLAVWNHEITLGGGGNWEFEWYTNNRSNSYVRDGVLYMRPTFTADHIGESNLQNGYTLSLWGAQPGTQCTGHAFYGCERTSGAGGNILNPIKSARLRTVYSLNFKYGRVEFRAKLPRGDWIWPALWMLPTTAQYGDWPASGEIDIMESRGNAPGYSSGGGYDTFGSTMHWGPAFGANGWEKTHELYKLPSGTLADDFHTYGFIWREDYMATYFDKEDNIVMKVPINQTFWQLGGFDKTNYANPWAGRGKNAPFDQSFYLVMNVAVGGTGDYFPDGVGGKPWSNKDDHAVNAFWSARPTWSKTWDGENTAMKIDYVKVWSL